MVRSPQPRPEGVEQLAGGFPIEDDHALTGVVRIDFDQIVAFGDDQIGEPRGPPCVEQ
jgi:hypothetical protein